MRRRHQWVNSGSWSEGSKPYKYWQLIIGILRKCIMAWVPSSQTLLAAQLVGSNFRISLLMYIFSNAQTTVWPTHLPRAVQRLCQPLADASKIHSGFHGGNCSQVLDIPALSMHECMRRGHVQCAQSDFWCFSLYWPVLLFEREIKIGLWQN